MKNANDAKERAIQEVKNQLEVKQLRVEDESAQQERSEPESTFSDLTDSSMSAKISGKVANAEGKVANAEGEAHDDEKVKNPKSRKAQRVMVSHQSTLSSSGSSGAENEAKTTITDSTMSNLSENTNTNGENRAGGSNRSMSSNATTGDFKLDFQEVFIKSNIPQLLATDSGTIVTCECYFSSCVDGEALHSSNTLSQGMPSFWKSPAWSQRNYRD